MLAYWLIIAHLVGDYLLQSDWMALKKTNSTPACLAHVVTYAVPFVALTRDPWVLGFIVSTHFMIDRWRLARFVCWGKNFIAPKWIHTGARQTGEVAPGRIDTVFVFSRNQPWAECSKTGYHESRPDWLAFWLLIIADNTLHLLCNGLAFEALARAHG